VLKSVLKCFVLLLLLFSSCNKPSEDGELDEGVRLLLLIKMDNEIANDTKILGKICLNNEKLQNPDLLRDAMRQTNNIISKLQYKLEIIDEDQNFKANRGEEIYVSVLRDIKSFEILKVNIQRKLTFLTEREK